MWFKLSHSTVMWDASLQKKSISLSAHPVFDSIEKQSRRPGRAQMQKTPPSHSFPFLYILPSPQSPLNCKEGIPSLVSCAQLQRESTWLQLCNCGTEMEHLVSCAQLWTVVHSCSRGKSCKREHLWLQLCPVCSREKPPFFLPPFPSQATVTSPPWTAQREHLVTIVHGCSREKPPFLLSLSLHRLPPSLDSSEIESKTRDVHHVRFPQHWKAAHSTFPSHWQENLQEIY